METVNQGASTAQQAEQGTEKTFTQAEVDSIVKERLGREQTKFADYEELKKKAESYDAAEEANKSEDHPRVCGKDWQSHSWYAREIGSPPRMRERRLCGIRPSARFGITPAYAGKTRSFVSRTRSL